MQKKDDFSKKKPVITGCLEIAKGNWLQIDRMLYNDRQGTARTWECAKRIGSRGAVLIIPILKRTGAILLIRQFRPPVNNFVIEFPAGLIDPGESAEQTAVRELLEETGYHGKIVKVLPAAFNSPGMSTERITPVIMEIDEERHELHPPEPRMEDSEYIETFIVPSRDIQQFIGRAQAGGDELDSKVVAFSLGQTLMTAF